MPKPDLAVNEQRIEGVSKRIPDQKRGLHGFFVAGADDEIVEVEFRIQGAGRKESRFRFAGNAFRIVFQIVFEHEREVVFGFGYFFQAVSDDLKIMRIIVDKLARQFGFRRNDHLGSRRSGKFWFPRKMNHTGVYRGSASLYFRERDSRCCSSDPMSIP